MSTNSSMEISENESMPFGEPLLKILLFDRTTRRNIIWGTTDYEHLGGAYKAQLPITINLITGANKNTIQPRVYKEKINQANRTKEKAEVFTPSWMCNEQNNLIDEAWFGCGDVFNKQQGRKWTATKNPILFDNKHGKKWENYVDAKRLEIACGEAPYLVSRYDTVTGEQIELPERIGLLDRKLRIVNENVSDKSKWMNWVFRAFQSIYGFEFQGDNLLLARENLLFTFIDYFRYRFNCEPSLQELKPIAHVISWNLWQMDSMYCAVPFSAGAEQIHQRTLDESEPCFCKIRDWRSKKTVLYASLVQ